jgi:uncharacterized protein
MPNCAPPRPVSDRRLVAHLLCFAAPNKSSAKMKFLLLVALFLAVYLLWRKAAASRSSARPPAPRAPERMVKCAHCGVNQPVSESILTHGRYYCCNAHRQEAESRDG